MKLVFSSRERVAGLFILASFGLVIFFFVGAGVHNRWLAPRVSFYTDVARGDALRTGSPVLLSGVEIGEIGDIQIREDNRIDVELVVLRSHAHRVRRGTEAVVRRLLGIGEKRVHLSAPGGSQAALEPGSRIVAREPLEILDVVAELDVGSYMQTLNRALAHVELLLTKLEEDGRFERIVAAFDRIGPTLEKVDTLLGEVHAPVVELLTDPSLRGTLHGADQVLGDPNLRRTLRGAASVLDPKRIDPLLERTTTLLMRLDALTADKGPVPRVLQGADKFLSDGRIDRLIGSLERLTDEEKLGRIIDNVALLAEQTRKIGPEIPEITRELTATLREAVIVLRALQKTWLLEGKAQDARRELQKEK